MTVIAWGGDGASGGGLTWPVARRGHVQGFPCRHYGRCVLDEHIAKRPMPERAKCIEAERNGREQKSPDGRPRGRSIYLDWRLTGRPSSQYSQWPDRKRGVAMVTLARGIPTAAVAVTQ